MFLDQVPPDTSSYMVAGYAIFFIVTAIYLASLFVRTRNLDRDMSTLEGIEEESKQPAALRAAAEAASARANKASAPRRETAPRKASRKTAAAKKPAARKTPRKK